MTDALARKSIYDAAASDDRYIQARLRHRIRNTACTHKVPYAQKMLHIKENALSAIGGLHSGCHGILDQLVVNSLSRSRMLL